MKQVGTMALYKNSRWKRLKESKPYYWMMLLPFLYYVIFCYIPMGGLVIAFQDYNAYQGFLDSPWIGIKYFQDFLSDPYFFKLFRNTILLGLYQIIFAFPAPIIMALLLNELKHTRFKKTIQTISYMPHFLSTVVVAGILVNFLSFDGLINQFLGAFGVQNINWLMDPQYFRGIYTVSGIWQNLGWGSIVYLAALTGVDQEQYEAATIDGASRLQQMIKITIPNIWPTIIIMFIFQVGSIMSVSFEKVLLLYNGAIYETADVISTYVYRRGILSDDFSYATAVGMFNSLVALFFLSITNFISKKTGETSLW